MATNSIDSFLNITRDTFLCTIPFYKNEGVAIPFNDHLVAWTPLESLWDSDLIDLLVMAVERIQNHTRNAVRSQSAWLSGKVSGVAAVQPVFDGTGCPA